MEKKFKAWDKELKFWVDPSKYFIEFDGSAWYNLGTDDDRDNLLDQTFKLEVIQYIGEEDRNKIELYEEDICINDYGGGVEIGVIVFDSGCFRLKCKHDDSFHTPADIDFSLLEKIGNRLESPELWEAN